MIAFDADVFRDHSQLVSVWTFFRVWRGGRRSGDVQKWPRIFFLVAPFVWTFAVGEMGEREGIPKIEMSDGG